MIGPFYAHHNFNQLHQGCINCGRSMLEVFDLRLPCSDEPEQLAQAMLREARQLRRKAEHLLGKREAE